METKGSVSPFIPMFKVFQNQLDEHHDRRERIIKASRDITALGKKMYTWICDAAIPNGRIGLITL
jgi:hypothetical protein